MSEIQRYRFNPYGDGLEPDKDGWLVYATAYDALTTRLAAAESELRKWRAGARPDDLEALRVQVEKSPTSLAAKQAYINGLCCELATSQAEATRLRTLMEQAASAPGIDWLYWQLEFAKALAQPKETPQ